MNNLRLTTVIAAAAIAASGAGAAVTVAGCGSSPPSSSSPATGPQGAGSENASSYSYYRSMMGSRYGGSMMGGSGYGWMMGERGYRWMMGGTTSAPAWMLGSALPPFMMGTGMMGHDPGTVMGALWANAPGPRVTAAQAARLGNQVPAGASINRAANRISFSGTSVHLVVLGSPSGGPDETFRIAGLTNPAIAVPRGARVAIEFINADPDMAHGIVFTTAGPALARTWMPMMTAAPAFSGAALWFLGNPTAAGMHTAALAFTAAKPGRYQYLCPVPGHAQKGMAGSFTVTGAV